MPWIYILHARQSKMTTYVVVVLATLVSWTDAATHPSREPDPCKIIGDHDVHGLGIRLDRYFEWATICIALST